GPRLGSRWQDHCAVLYRSGIAGAGSRRKARPAPRPSEGRPFAICHHLVRSGGCDDDRLRLLAARATARMMQEARLAPGFLHSVPVAMAVMAPAVMMSAAAAPPIVMTASAAVTSHLDKRVILHQLYRQWCNPQPGG